MRYLIDLFGWLIIIAMLFVFVMCLYVEFSRWCFR